VVLLVPKSFITERSAKFRAFLHRRLGYTVLKSLISIGNYNHAVEVS
jgi:hypothetical protein